MLAPKLGPDYSTPFLAQLIEAGFSWWVTLPKHTGFYAALGFGLLMHTFPTYPEYSACMTGTVLPRLHSLKTIDDAFTAKSGADRLYDAEFWYAIGEQCKAVCAALFREFPPKPEVEERIKSGRLAEFDDKAVYVRIAKHFFACICIHIPTNTGIKSLEFYNADVGGLGLLVCLASEQDEVSVLVHRSFVWDELSHEAYPNYIKTKPKGRQTPPLSNSATDSQTGETGKTEPVAAVTALIHTINDLSSIIRASVSQLDHSFSGVQESLRSRQILVTDYFSRHPSYSGAFNLAALQPVLDLPVSPPPQPPSPEHTVQNCEQFPDDPATFLEYHGHRYHDACLYAYIVAKVNDGIREFQCPMCPQLLPGIVVDNFPELKKWLQEWKMNIVPNLRHSPQSQCVNCRATLPVDLVSLLSHGCSLCASCGSSSLAREVCSRCGEPLTSGDCAAIKAVIVQKREVDNSMRTA